MWVGWLAKNLKTISFSSLQRLDDRTKGRTLNAYDGDAIPTTM